jgi:putative membrane-bound dehydrogenase-like protein
MKRCRLCLVLALLALPRQDLCAQKNFGFDNRKASGQEYISAQESVKRFKVPPGWEVTVFAAEPDVINPIAFSVDERGRLWVVECFEYPKRTAKGKKPRDRIKILEDTQGTGKADKVTVWADGKNLPIGWDLASGLEVGHGGVFLGAPPYLFFLSDTKGTGRCDRQEVLLKGFGSQDTHETLNTFQWGPDGKLYGLHGVFTHSEVNGVKLDAAVWTYDVPAKKFGIFAEGTSNPWGMDFDRNGDCFLACCVIPHLFHMVPGGNYIRQGGTSFNPYAFGQLKEICDHVHHKESGWAHAGLIVLEGETIPRDLRGSLLMGSIHGCSVKRDELRPNGSTYVGTHASDFLVSGDKNLRPINMRWGPDGSIYLIDWHDQNPCHQAEPDSWDMTHGRIYKIQRTGTKPQPPADLGKLPSRDLALLLCKDNPYWYRTALRILNERKDAGVAKMLKDLIYGSKDATHALRGLWGLYAVGAFDEATARKALEHANPYVRSWSIRLLGEANLVTEPVLLRLTALAETEAAPQVRSQLASTAQRLSKLDTLPLLHVLMKHKEDRKDPNIPLLIWLAYEPRVTAQRNAALDWLKDHAADNPLVAEEIVPRTIRRLVATGKTEDLEACVAFLGAVNRDVRRLALEGLAQALKSRQVEAPPSWKRVAAELRKDGDAKTRELARRLAVNFQDRAAIARSLAVAVDTSKGAGERVDAIRDLALAHPAEAQKPLRDLVLREEKIEVRVEACRALASYDSPELAEKLLGGWKKYPPALRGEAVSLLAGRKTWAKDLLAAVGKGTVTRTDLNDNTILRIRAFNDKSLNQQIETVWGRFRDSPKELAALIDKMRGQLYQGRASFARGKLVFENQCAKCHKFDGKGHEVGPNLEGAARDIEYLLVNVIDPNRVVGQPYYIRTVELKSGRIESGLLHAEDEQSITLKVENDVLKVIQRKDIEGKIQIQDKSMMPEGLANNMTVQDFRDLIRYLMAHPFLTEVALAGPESGSNVDTLHPLSSPGVRWTWPLVGVPGRIPLPAAKGGKTTAHVGAEVTAPSSLRTRLQLGAAYPIKVWLNGKVVYEGQPGPGPAQPDQDGVDVDLSEGANRLLVQITYQGDNEAIYARFLDPDRKLRYGERK